MPSKTEIEAESLIETLVNDAIAGLRRALADAGRRGLHVLIDPAMADPVLGLCTAHDLPIKRLNVPYGDVSAQVRPYLVTVKDEEKNERFVNETITLAVKESIAAREAWPTPRSVCAWLIMDEPNERVFIEQFARRALVRQPGNAGQRRLLRYWDPRVHQQLPAIVGNAFWSAWMKVTMTWLSIDPWGRLQKQQLGSVAGKSNEAWPRDRVAVDALERIGEVNQCLAMSGVLQRTPDDRVYQRFDRLLMQASQLGCNSTVDRVTYAVVTDSLGLPLEQHPRIASMLERTRHDEASFSDLLSVLEPQDWESIRDELARIADFKNNPHLVQVSP